MGNNGSDLQPIIFGEIGARHLSILTNLYSLTMSMQTLQGELRNPTKKVRRLG